MTLRSPSMIGTLGIVVASGLLVLAGCGGSAGERGVPGPAVGEGIGAAGGSTDPPVKEAEARDSGESASEGLIESELGYPVQDERLGEHAGY